MPQAKVEEKAREVRQVPIADLRPFDRNPRRISDSGLEKLAGSLRTFGFVNPILAQASSGLVIAGHQRLKAAALVGLEVVPVLYLDVDDETATAYNIADNRLAEESDWDRDTLAGLLSDLEGDASLSAIGMSEDELRELIALSTIEFPEYGKDAADRVAMLTCPSCGHEFPA